MRFEQCLFINVKIGMAKVTGWRAVVRIKGYPTVCGEFERKQEAEDWEEDTRRLIKAGQFQFERHKLSAHFLI